MSGEQTLTIDSVDNPHHPYDVSKYSSIAEANVSLNESSNARQLSVLYVNIVSLFYNIGELTRLLSQFDKKPDLIVLSETKITDKVHSDYNPHINGYSFKNMPSKTHFGSAGVFFHNSLDPIFRDDLNCTEKGLYQMLWFDINSQNRKTTFGILYRHGGNTEIPFFTNRLEKLCAS